MTDLSSRIRHALLADPDEAVGSRLSGATITAAVERIVGALPSHSGLRYDKERRTIVGETTSPSRDDVLEEAAKRANACIVDRFLQPCGGLTPDWMDGFGAGCEFCEAAIRALKSDGGSPGPADKDAQ